MLCFPGVALIDVPLIALGVMDDYLGIVEDQKLGLAGTEKFVEIEDMLPVSVGVDVHRVFIDADIKAPTIRSIPPVAFAVTSEISARADQRF